MVVSYGRAMLRLVHSYSFMYRLTATVPSLTMLGYATDIVASSLFSLTIGYVWGNNAMRVSIPRVMHNPTTLTIRGPL